MITLIELELQRLEKKYHGALTKKDLMKELNISLPTLDRYLKNGENIPNYKRFKSGKILFPISATAFFLSHGLIQTV